MQLFFLLLLLLVPYLTLSILGQWSPRFKVPPSFRARVGLSIFFAFTAIGHFIRTEQMAAMLPDALPYRVELIYITGVFEFFGALGIWFPSLAKTAGFCLIVLLVGVLPANIYSAFHRVDFGGHGAGPSYLLWRVPFQLFVIWWTYMATEQKWFRRNGRYALAEKPT